MCPCVVSFLPLLPLPPLTLSTDVAQTTKWNVLQLIDCSPLRSIPITGTSSLLWALLTSHSSLLLRLMRPPVRPPRLRCTLFPLIYLPHLLVLPATFGLHRFWPTYPYFPALYVVPVRQAKGLPTASFRFHLTVDTLAVQLCTSSLPTCTRDFHPLERAHGAQTKNTMILGTMVFLHFLKMNLSVHPLLRCIIRVHIDVAGCELLLGPELQCLDRE